MARCAACVCATAVFSALVLALAISFQGESPSDEIRANLQEALRVLLAAVPEEAASINEHEEEIVDELLDPSDSASAFRASKLRSVQFSFPSRGNLSGDLEVESARLPSKSVMPPGCTAPLTTVVLDVVDVAQSLLAFHLPKKGLTLSYGAWVIANPQTGESLLPDISALQKATDISDRAGAFFELAKKMFKSKGFDALWNAIRATSMTWWDWVSTCVIMIAQLLLWFASQAAAFVAQLTIVLLSATDLVLDAKTCIDHCNVNLVTESWNHSTVVI